MTVDPPDASAQFAGTFEYFMLRLARSGTSADRLAGQLERLGTGEKQRFDSAEQLVSLVSLWPEPVEDERTPP